MLEWMIAIVAVCGVIAAAGLLLLLADVAVTMHVTRRRLKDFPYARVIDRRS